MTKPKNNSAAFDLSEAERVTQRDLASVQETRTDLLERLAAGVDVTEELNVVDSDIEELQAKLSRFTEARAAHRTANTTAARAARHEDTLAKLAEAVVGAEQVATQAKAVLAALANLGTELSKLEDTRSGVHQTLIAATEVAREGAPNERIAIDMVEHIRNALAASTLPTAFLMALYETGIGRRGVQVPAGTVDVQRLPPYIQPSDADSQSETALARVRKLAEQIAEWSANTTKENAA
jgi:hypothetical protein